MIMLDIEQLKLWWNTFVGDGNFTEVRILGKFSYSGYFRSFDNLVRQLEPYTNMDDEQIYFVLNKISDDCYARPQCEKFVKSPKVTTKDDEIVRRKFLLLDFDPIRRSQTNSSSEQFELAHKKAQDVFRFLREKGWSEPIICVSGNGWHILVPVDLPCNKETDKIIKDFYTYMGSVFTDDKVEFDEKVFTNARLTKLYSTWAKKGANVPSNPWRQSKIVYIPQVITPTPIEKIKELADLVPKAEPKPTSKANVSSEKFDLEVWLNTYGIEYRKKQEGTSTKYEIKTCPWHETHSVDNPYSSALYQDAEGKITYTCAHSHCKDKQWKDFRLFYQPNAYDKPQYQHQQVVYIQQPMMRPKPKYEVKEEIPELGEKWKCFSSIQKIDLTKLEKVKTGFVELDKKIGGLYMSEVTVLSGSNGGGKSSWLNSVLLNIVEQGYKVALWSGELRADILKTWIQMVAAGKNNLRQSQYDDGRFYVPDNIGEKIDQWLDGKFFLYNNEYGNVASQIINDVKTLASAGVKVFVIDNLMATNLDCYDGDKNDRQKQYILDLKDIAMKEKLHIIVVAHPRKSIAFLRKNDISGTGDIINAVDNCFIFHRCNEDFQHAISEFYTPQIANYYAQFGNVLSVEKNRLMGVVDYMCGFFYEIESRRFKNEINENIRYGWEQNPTQSVMPFNNAPSTSNVSDMPFERNDSYDEAPF